MSRGIISVWHVYYKFQLANHFKSENQLSTSAMITKRIIEALVPRQLSKRERAAGGSFYLIVGRGARQVWPSTLLCYISLLLCYISMLSNWISQLGSWETNKVQPSSIWAFYNAALIFQ